MNAHVHPLGDPALHFFLTRSVARVLGISLSEAMQTGALSARDYAGMVNRCRQCPNVAQCQAWLGTAWETRPDAPAHCRNHDDFVELAPLASPQTALSRLR